MTLTFTPAQAATLSNAVAEANLAATNTYTLLLEERLAENNRLRAAGAATNALPAAPVELTITTYVQGFAAGALAATQPRLDAELFRWGWHFMRSCSERNVARGAPVLADLCVEYGVTSGQAGYKRLTTAQKIHVHGVAMRRVLVEMDWSTVMSRAGLCGPHHILRQRLADLLTGADVSPRAPTAAELEDMLSVQPARSRMLLPKLLATMAAGAEPPSLAPRVSEFAWLGTVAGVEIVARLDGPAHDIERAGV